MGLHIENDAGRCLNCKNPMCQQHCPVHTPIPYIIRLFKENKLLQAGELLFETNPMSAVCATVCSHETQCAGHCVLGKKGTPVQFYNIEKYISEAYLDRMKCTRAPSKGKSAAIIGSGPAGMTAAIILAKNGYKVTIFDEKDKIGGMLQYGIPEFRLPKTILARYKEKMLQMGIQIRPNTVMGGALTIENLFRDGYASVLVATGVWRPKTLGIQGECLAGVHFGIAYLANPTAYDLEGKTVAVIGMGNVAMDVARTALRKGAHRVMLFSRDKSVTASAHEAAYARLDGAEFVFGRTIEKITSEGPVFRVAVFDDKDDVIGFEEERELVEADCTIIAVSQGPKDKLVTTTRSLESTAQGLLVVNDKFMTTREGVFAAGDVVHGSKTVVHAVEDAKMAAMAMMEYMEKETAVC